MTDPGLTLVYKREGIVNLDYINLIAESPAAADQLVTGSLRIYVCVFVCVCVRVCVCVHACLCVCLAYGDIVG